MRVMSFQDFTSLGWAKLPLVLFAMVPLGRGAMPPHEAALHGRREAPAPMAAADTTLAAQLATITTDTGAFAPGHLDFSRYNTPALCRAAALLARSVFRRGVEALSSSAKEVDTAGLGATARVARACGARFTLENTTDQQRGDLFELALYEQNDSLAKATLDWQVAHGITEEAVGPINYPGFASYGYKVDPEVAPDIRLGALRKFLTFGRYAAAEALLAQVKAQGPAGRWSAFFMHLEIVWNDKLRDVNPRLVLHADSIVIRLGLDSALRNIGYRFVLGAYQQLMAAAILGDTLQIRTLALQAKHDLNQWPRSQQGYGDVSYSDDWSGPEVTSAQFKKLVPQWYFSVQHLADRPMAPRLQADFWFPAAGRPMSDTVIPRPGKINLICGGGWASDDIDDLVDEVPVDDETSVAYTQAVHIKHWLAQYGAAGLVVTIVRPASGGPDVFFGHEHIEVYTKDSVAEAGFWHWYDQQYHALPVTEAVVLLHNTQWLPAPDGRRTALSQPLDTTYFQMLEDVDGYENGHSAKTEEGACTLISRDGRILFSDAAKRTHSENTSPQLKARLTPSNVDAPWSDLLKWVFNGHDTGSPSQAQAPAPSSDQDATASTTTPPGNASWMSVSTPSQR